MTKRESTGWLNPADFPSIPQATNLPRRVPRQREYANLAWLQRRRQRGQGIFNRDDGPAQSCPKRVSATFIAMTMVSVLAAGVGIAFAIASRISDAGFQLP